MGLDIIGFNLTEPNSFVSVAICQKPSGFLVSFPRSRKLFAKVVNLPGTLFGDDSPFEGMIFVPRSNFEGLKRAIDGQVDWRGKEAIENDKSTLQIDQETLVDVLNRIENDRDYSFLKVDPFSFQKLAVSWALDQKGKGDKVVGGLLADQMGLGKTLEGLATACALKSEGMSNRTLVICPATLKTQWQQEIEKFTNEDSVIIGSVGSKSGFDVRKTLYDKVRSENPFFTIINYELLYQREVKRTIELKSKTSTGRKRTKKIYGDYLDLNQIKDLGFDTVIIDEAHKMKNPDTLAAKAIREIDADFKLLMTGTPIEKELKNIFQLFDYIDPSILSDPALSFDERRERFESLFTVRRLNPFIYPAREVEYIGEMNTEVLRKRINPFMLRRLTEDVSDEMPSQVVNKITVDFADFQKKLYDKATNEMKALKEKIDKTKIENELELEKLNNNFRAFAQSRAIICDTPSVLLGSNSFVAKKLIGKRKSFPMIPKVERLLDLVDEICLQNNEKVVIFTRYSRVADYLNDEITKLFRKHEKKNKLKKGNIFTYKGETKEGCSLRDLLGKQGKDKSSASCFGCSFYDTCETRTKYAWHFQNDPSTQVLVATDAGNFGVNLQKGKHLINYDLPDSFSTYLQRNGRIRRLGSEHDQIFIHNMVTHDAVDEKKLVQIEKQMKVNDKVLENKESDKDAIKEADAAMEKLLDEI